MTIYKIHGKNNATTLIGSHLESETRCRVILGVGYTTHESIVSYAGRQGYGVSKVAEIPDEYVNQCERLDAFGITLLGTPLLDAQDSDSIYKVTGSDGHTQYDIRDIINGIVTA